MSKLTAINNTDKPREFWLDFEDCDGPSIFDEHYKNAGWAMGPNWIHVIEYSVYEQAIEALREIMRVGTGSQGNSVEATIAYEALGKLNEFLRE